MVLGHPTVVLQVLLASHAALWQCLASALFWVPFLQSEQINKAKLNKNRAKYNKILVLQIIFL